MDKTYKTSTFEEGTTIEYLQGHGKKKTLDFTGVELAASKNCIQHEKIVHSISYDCRFFCRY